MAFATKPKPAPSHKKRTGHHRKHSEQYLKHYWPYLPLLAIVGVGLLFSSWWGQPGKHVLGADSNLSSQALIASTNADRSQNDVANLHLNAQLTQAAETKAEDMVHANYWSHNTPSGRTPWSFIVQAGYDYQTAGENLAYGFSSANDVLTAWMNSPEHRANLLNSGYSQVGFGVASSPDYVGSGPETVVVAMYASPQTSAAPILQQSSGDASVKGVSVDSQPVARVALLPGMGSSWSSIIVAAMMSLAIVVFILRHGYLLRRSLVRGELFVVEHPVIDVIVVLVATAGFVLTRAGGFVL